MLIAAIPIPASGIATDLFALRRGEDYYYEIIKEGNVAGDDDNWALKVEGNNLAFFYKEGTWKRGGIDMERPQ
jgi:hypothetical protein